MKPVVGIICEYDPFHRGHARHFTLIRDKLPEASIVCIMSGPFTQRGMPALYAPAFRARAALSAGAALVLECPSLFTLREAEHFALGGVSILDRLGFITHISFGCETDNLSLLSAAAGLLEKPTALFQSELQTALQKGISYAAAQGTALEKCLSHPTQSPFAQDEALAEAIVAPNNILAISYLRSLQRLSSGIQPLPVLREGAYHAKSLRATGYPSATAVRSALQAGDMAAAQEACGYPLPPSPLCLPQALDAPLLFQLRQMTKAQLAALPDCTEGLENRLYAASRAATNRAELMALLKTKRYPYVRLNRLCSHALLGITTALQQAYPLPPYARLLGFSQEGQPLLPLLRKSHIPILSKAADGPRENPAFQLDIRAYDLWALGAKQPAGWMLRQPVERV